MTIAYSYIRFSSKKQASGDSERRQEVVFEQACSLHKWTPGDALLDGGLSAYTGANLADGSALRRWVDALQAGAVPRGSVLVVEYLDRLTRLPVAQGVALFLQIINAGGSIYVANLARLWSQETINSGLASLSQITNEILISFTSSQRTQERILASCVGRRLKAKDKIAQGEGDFYMGYRVPFWLRVENKCFVEIPEQVIIVRRIFDLYLEGNGGTRIARILNDEGYLRFNGRKWVEWMIYPVLNAVSVCGVLEHYERIGGVMADYYPVVVEYDVFEQAMVLMSAKQNPGGRKPKSVKCFNLFSGLLECGECGSGMRIITDVKNTKYNRLACRAEVAGQCSMPKVRYSDFELGVLDFLFGQYDLLAVIKKENKMPVDARMLVDEKIKRAKHEQQNIAEAFRGGIPPRVMLERLRVLEDELINYEKELVEVMSLSQPKKPWLQIKNEYWEVVKIMNSGTDEEKLSIRTKLAQHLQLVLNKLIIRRQEGDLRLVEVVADEFVELIKIPSEPCRAMKVKSRK